MSLSVPGLDIVRRDWCQLASDAGKEILAKILSDCSADDRVNLFVRPFTVIFFFNQSEDQSGSTEITKIVFSFEGRAPFEVI